MIRIFKLGVLFAVVVQLALASAPAATPIPIVFDFQDSPGEGFFDNTPLNDLDVPSASTVGEARRLVLQAAGNHLGSFFEPRYSGETWRIAARFDPLDGGIAGAAPTEWRDGSTFSGGTSAVNYPAVLVNHLAETELVLGNVIDAEFDTNTVFDFDTTAPPSNFEESLFSTAVHEILHGLGFFSDIEEDGFYFDGNPAIFDTFLTQGTTPVTSMNRNGRSNALVSDNLFFNGPQAMAANPLGAGPVKIHAPTNFESGSTGSHLDRVAFASTGDLMLPEAPSNFTEQIFLSQLDTAILADLGFQLATTLPDLDSDGDLDGTDFLLIQRTNPALINDWVANYGSGAALATSQAIPEPSSLLLGLTGVLMCAPRRRNSLRA